MQDEAFGELVLAASGTLDVPWLSTKLGKSVEVASVRGMDKVGGMSAEFRLVDVVCEGGEQLSLALKTKIPASAALGDAREAIFYNELAGSVDVGLPRAFYAHGDMTTGRKAVLMECLQDAVPAGVAFGDSNPNNWGIKHELEKMAAGIPSAEAMSAKAFELYAALHAQFWLNTPLLDKPWLRGAAWIRGEGAEAWLYTQKMASDAWGVHMEARAAGMSPITWDDHLVACLNQSFGSISWDAYQAELQLRPYTVVQGDCHPGNAMWVGKGTEAARIFLIDFEMVGLGSAAQELGQWMISHMDPAVRRGCERALVEGYHTQLIANLNCSGSAVVADNFDLEACWVEYMAGGAGRWA